MTSHSVESSTVTLDAHAVMTVEWFAEWTTMCVLAAHAKGFDVRHAGHASNLGHHHSRLNHWRRNYYLRSRLLNNNGRGLLINYLRLLLVNYLRCLLIYNLRLLLVYNLRLLLINNLRLLLLLVVLLRLLLWGVGLHRHLLLRVVAWRLLLRILLLLWVSVLLLLRLLLIVHL